MTLSYNWLCEYLPESITGLTDVPNPEKISKILTSIGLEVESLEIYESIKGGMQGLVVGHVLTCEKHPDADKLKITSVDIGQPEKLQIVCGASNVAAGQKVIVATIGTTIYPVSGDAMTMKKAKIRGVESQGMICAEDEIGMSENHEGIMILPENTLAGTAAAEIFKPYTDHIYEIGLTPNRMDAMSHIGVARDVCAYYSHHFKLQASAKLPYKNAFKPDSPKSPVAVIIENQNACQRYSGVTIQHVTIAESPAWLQQRLKSIGLKPINNIVDITNFILHETGQPLHAFDAGAIAGNQVIVKNLPEGTPFVTLDEKERKLSAGDLMICNEKAPMCIAGVYGGIHSGVTVNTKNIFLESAWFNPADIRKTSVKHGLRTDAATRFEKGVDISGTVQVLKRAALMIKEIAGGEIAGEVVDVYPIPLEKTELALKYHYLKKLSGKNYHSDTVKKILNSLGFELLKEGDDEMRFNVPFSKPDITHAADIVEEIMRIDGLDNVEIPASISIAPAIETNAHEAAYSEKAANHLAGAGFSEIFTNSITNSKFYSEHELASAVKMINNLSEELDIMRPKMLETGLAIVAYNNNRKINDLKFFEFGKSYHTKETGKYAEENHLALYMTGNKTAGSWQAKPQKTDFYFGKAVVEKLIHLLGLTADSYQATEHPDFSYGITAFIKNETVATLGMVSEKRLDLLDIRQPVFYADLYWDKLLKLNSKVKIKFNEIPKFPTVNRDLAIIVNRSLPFEEIDKVTGGTRLNKLKSVKLFDIFESEKLGTDKKSMAISYTFSDEEKTLTDKEIDGMMNKIIAAYEKELGAEIRK